MNNRLYVGNLSFHTSEDSLREMVSAHGQVERIDFPTDRETGRMRGFGFVTMASSEDAQRVIAALDGATLDGRALRVNEAQERSGGGGGRGPSRSGGARSPRW